jgi:hypothetical protein
MIEEIREVVAVFFKFVEPTQFGVGTKKATFYVAFF